MRLSSDIRDLIEESESELSGQDVYSYLPEIVETLELIHECLENRRCDEGYQRRLIGGLGRLVTENYGFSESELGNRILKFITEYRAYLLDNDTN